MKHQQDIFKFSTGFLLPFISVRPEISAGPAPLLLFLHGIKERGTDNASQLRNGKEFFQRAAAEFGFTVIAPQCPPDDYWANSKWEDDSHLRMSSRPTRTMEAVIEMLDNVIKTENIDRTRISAIGLSMGGFGTWDIITRCPELFASAVPICGGGDPSKAAKITGIAIWAFHGALDDIVPVEFTRQTITALRDAGAQPRYTEYPDIAHNSWTPAFNDPDLLPWLAAQKKK